MMLVRKSLWEKILVQVSLARLFALPGALGSICLGSILGGIIWDKLIFAFLSGLFMMAWAHSMNSFLDYEWTGLDKGREHERSRRKIYTGAQNLIGEGKISPKGVLISSIFFLILSAIFALLTKEILILIPWLLIFPLTFWYSWAKLHYHPELPLGLGFGCLAVVLGNSVSESPDLIKAFLAGIPYMIMFGFVAETYDQYFDADVNWNRGLRNIGSLVWRYDLSISKVLLFLSGIAYLSQVVIVSLGILSPKTLLSLLALVFIIPACLWVENKPKEGVITGLLGIFLFNILIVIGQYFE